MNLLPVLEKLNIRYETEGHKHCRPGWANMPCPYCVGGNFGYHLGFRLDGERCFCWRCGGKNVIKALMKITGMTYNQIKPLLSQYKGQAPPTSVQSNIKIKRRGFKFPSDLSALTPRHKQYLKSRRFNPDKLEKLWDLKATGPLSTLDKISYKHRIVAPIMWEGKVVSFQARDITNKHDVKYLACPKPREEILHQHIVYANPLIDWGLPVIVCEGISDVWRFGIQAICTFGIDFLPAQIRAVTSNKRKTKNKQIMVVFDDDPQAIVKAEQLVAELLFRGYDAKKIDIVGDPGAMPQFEANQLVHEILHWRL